MAKRPSVLTRCNAQHYAAPNERIIEIGNGQNGGLVSLRTMPDGTLLVDFYRLDKGVTVRVSAVDAA